MRFLIYGLQILLLTIGSAATAVADTNDEDSIKKLLDDPKGSTNFYTNTAPTVLDTIRGGSKDGPDIDDTFDATGRNYRKSEFGAYTVEAWDYDGNLKPAGGGFQISTNGKVVYSRAEYLTGNPEAKDIDGDGVAELVIRISTGGNACCEMAYLFSTKSELKLIDIVSGYFSFTDSGDGGSLEISSSDSSIRYLLGCGACVEYPPLEYRLTDQGFQLDAELMRANSLSESELKAAESKNKLETLDCSSFISCTDGGGLATLALRLLYSGEINRAYALVERYTGEENAEAIMNDLLDQLGKSPSFLRVAELFGWI